MPGKKVTIAFIASPEIETALKKTAAEQERSQSWLIRKALELYLGLSRPAARRPKRR